MLEIPLVQTARRNSSFGAGIVDPHQMLVLSDPAKPGPHRELLLCLLLGLVQNSSTASRAWL